ncbi:uncharacterized protein LOC127285431 [Leptopilina boulardi]|uniref:uncharacterized protein LOC127285431 n=1 Tax=Leptopilina boulardi TaxID=63433 RepID=UPI0021F5AB25|nr:uncharacterized protein LOC127285431 [Leptopilina boulardi]
MCLKILTIHISLILGLNVCSTDFLNTERWSCRIRRSSADYITLCATGTCAVARMRNGPYATCREVSGQKNFAEITKRASIHIGTYQENGNLNIHLTMLKASK